MKDDFKELQCLENILPEAEMWDFQNIGVQKALLNQRMLLSFATGLGKTFTYGFFVRGLLNRNPEKKHILIIIHDSIEQAPKDLATLVMAPIVTVSSENGQLNELARNWNTSSVILLTYECFRRNDMYLFLYERINEVESFSIDEAHHASNWDESDIAFRIRALAQYCSFRLELSATPASLTRGNGQYYRLLNIVDRRLSPRSDETYLNKYDERYMVVNRKDKGLKGDYHVTLETVPPMEHQKGDVRGIVFKTFKGTGAVHQVEALMRVVSNRLKENKRVIVYVNYHDSRHWVERHLEDIGIPYVSLHGKVVKQSERKAILASFDSGEVNVLLTSVSESLNIDADVVIFYEFTTKLKQVMGRAHRGLQEKALELVFIITENSQEVDFFMEYIYKRSMTIERLLGLDYSEFIEVGDKLKKMKLQSKDTTI